MLDERMARLERNIYRLRAYLLTLTLGIGGLLVVSFTQKDGELIRTRGIIIEDEKGRERILIGAPLPYAKNRIRTDTGRVKELWGKRFPQQYMEWYKSYSHNCNGIVILDENGYDRMAVGSPTPDPNIGRRIGPATGIEINDEQGFERTGYGILNVNGKNRVVLGLDGEDGREGAYLILREDGTTGLGIRHRENTVFLGNANAGDFSTGLAEKFFGLIVRDTGKVRYKLDGLGKE